MSDILIKHMKLPENQVHVILNPNGLVEVLDENNILLEEYQAVSVPKHGRLIDADALLKGCERVATEYATREYAFSQSAIENAPTIILAEEGET